jgi:Do/DeqQ family serine protease
MKKIIAIILIGGSSGYFGAWLFQQQQQEPAVSEFITNPVSDNLSQFQTVENAQNDVWNESTSDDFVNASRVSTRSVVYIKNISSQVYHMSFMDMFFGEPGRTTEQISSGSGVIYSKDGYIVTNNHVVADADKIEVIHGKNSYNAELIGTDPSTDLAVLKIESTNLPVIPIGSSKNLQVGEWVIAVGNPFNLTSTVTGGIVSAKARSLHIVNDKFPIESFIQTDAAINPGNSGGALVNQKGELVGINTAILSRTGSYAGYGFAVPVDIVKKIVDDLIKYGEVQKAFLGADVVDLTPDVVNRLSLDVSNMEGVAVRNVQSGWGAAKAGVKEGDIILAINDETVSSKAEYDELLSYQSPGDRISLKWKRGQRVMEQSVVLSNREGTTDILKQEIYSSKYLGADLEIVPKVELDLFDIDGGIKIIKIYSGGLLASLDLEEGFIITRINQYKIDTPQKLVDVLSAVSGRVRVEGISKNGVKGYYTFYLR